MPKYLPYNCNQIEMIAINFADQLSSGTSGTFEHVAHYLVEKRLDLNTFHANYKNSDTGRYAYDPAVY
jgi:hypothetical protein